MSAVPAGYEVKDPGFPTEKENYLTNSKGFLSWAFTLDHKRIGMMYLVGVSSAFLIASHLKSA
ncbi:MAG: cytochrome c oxidase subunit I, partial [Planctomycetota bacterium]